MDVGIRIKEYPESIGVSQAFLSCKAGIPAPKLTPDAVNESTYNEIRPDDV